MQPLRQLKNAVRLGVALGGGGLFGKTVRSLRRGGIRDLAGILGNIWRSSRSSSGPASLGRNDYGLWVKRYDTLTAQDLSALEVQAAALAAKPLISVVMPTFNTRREWLVEAIESVRGQVYPHWELCIADDASTQSQVKEVLEHYAALDPRIRVALRTENGHISATTNTALALASGEWIALLDHDDIIPPHALFHVAEAINCFPAARMIYSDEDKITSQGERTGAYFKCDWNPDLFLAQNMFSHLGVFHAALVREVGGFRLGLEGSQDYDLALRCMEKIDRSQIVHIPRVLYHWRVHEESTAHSHDAKPYAHVAAERALAEHFARTGIAATTQRTASGYRTVRELPTPLPRVGIVVTGRHASRIAAACVRSVLSRTQYADFHIYVLTAVKGAGGGLTRDARVQVIEDEDESQAYFRAMSLLREQGCTVICLLDAATEVKNEEWLSEMVSQAWRPPVGLVGAKLVSRQGQIESAGVVLMPGERLTPMDAHRGYPIESYGYGGRAQLGQFFSAVRSNCVVLRLDIAQRVCAPGRLPYADGGLELSERVRSLGLEVAWTPYAEIIVQTALAPLGRREASAAQVDPAYNPNLHTEQADFTLAWPPLSTFPAIGLVPKAAAEAQ